MKNIKVSIRKYSRGSYSFYDFLYVNDSEKKMILKTSIFYGDDEKPLKAMPNFTFKKKIDSLSKKGYSLEKVDGATSRISKEEVLKALHLDFNKEKTYEMSKNRLEKFDYYSIYIIRRACRLYVQDLIDDSFFFYWSNLYIFALAESYSDIDDIKQGFFIESIIAILGSFNIVLSNSITRDEKKQGIRELYKSIKNLDDSYKEKHNA